MLPFDNAVEVSMLDFNVFVLIRTFLGLQSSLFSALSLNFHVSDFGRELSLLYFKGWHGACSYL